MKTENRGGRREGAGSGGVREGAGRKRKAATWSDAFKDDLVKALKAKLKETGKNIHEVMIDRMYEPDTDARAATAIYKAVCDALVQKSTHKEVEITETKLGPIVLPARLDADGAPSMDHVATGEARH